MAEIFLFAVRVFFFFGVSHCVLFFFCAEPKQNRRERPLEKDGFRIFDMLSLFSWCVCVCFVCGLFLFYLGFKK